MIHNCKFSNRTQIISEGRVKPAQFIMEVVIDTDIPYKCIQDAVNCIIPGKNTLLWNSDDLDHFAAIDDWCSRSSRNTGLNLKCDYDEVSKWYKDNVEEFIRKYIYVRRPKLKAAWDTSCVLDCHVKILV